MTAGSFCSGDGVGGCSIRAVSAREAVRCAGLMPPRVRCLGRCDEFSDVEDPFAEAFKFGVTGPSVVRSGAADSEVAPQSSALVACCRLP